LKKLYLLFSLIGLAGIGAIVLAVAVGFQQRQSKLHQSSLSNAASLNVLFVGNSFTYFNDMPALVKQLADAAHEEKPFMSVQETPGGYTLKQHWESGKVAQLIQSNRWDYVVLQEQSQALSFAQWQRFRDVHPYARQFNNLAWQNKTKLILFMTWGYEKGDLENRTSDSFSDMQSRLAEGNMELAKDLSAIVVPVGIAWRQALSRNPQIRLWGEDGRHPNLSGSYLAACVFYKLFYRKSPVGNPFTAGLSAREAYFLQDVAASAASTL
jgi:Domain of unknown function (DUF4886)